MSNVEVSRLPMARALLVQRAHLLLQQRTSSRDLFSSGTERGFNCVSWGVTELANARGTCMCATKHSNYVRSHGYILRGNENGVQN